MFMLTDWMAARMIQAGWIQKLDASKVPNLHANLISGLQNVSFDPKREYSAPWQSGLTGIAYNKSKVKEVEVLRRARHPQRPQGPHLAAVGDERHDGPDAARRGRRPDQLHRRRVGRRRWTSSRRPCGDGQVRSFTGNEYIQDLAAGNVVACEAWSGDVAAAEDENLVFVTPEEGHMIWADNMLVPNKATHKGNAEEWINFYYEPEVAAKLAAYV